MIRSIAVVLLVLLGFIATRLWPFGRVSVSERTHSQAELDEARLSAAVDFASYLVAQAAAQEARDQAAPAHHASLRICVVDDAEAPVAQAAVMLEQPADGGVAATASTTAADGCAELAVRGNAMLHVLVRTTDGREGVASRRFPGFEPESMIVRVADVATITGRVVDDGGRGVAGAELRLIPASHFGTFAPEWALAEFARPEPDALSDENLVVSSTELEAIKTTDAHGRFVLPVARDDAWVVLARAPGMTATMSEPVQLLAGGTREVELRLSRGHSFFGRVVDESGQPIRQASVTLTLGASFVGHVELDDAGAFRIDGAASEEAVVDVFAPRFVRRSLTLEADVESRVVLASGARYAAQVCVAGGTRGQVLNAWLESNESNAYASAELDALGCGRIEAAGLVPGDYRVMIAAPGLVHFGSARLDGELSERLLLPEHGVLRVRVAGLPRDLGQAIALSFENPGRGHASAELDAGGEVAISGALAPTLPLDLSWYDEARDRAMLLSKRARSAAGVVVLDARDARPMQVFDAEDDEPAFCEARLPLVQVGAQWMMLGAFEGHPVLGDVVPGDVLVGIDGAVVTSDEASLAAALGGPCDTSVAVRVLRPATGVTYALDVPREIVEHGCGG